MVILIYLLCIWSQHMSFIRKIRRGSRVYFAEVEGVREGRRVRQRLIRYIGTSPDALATKFPLAPKDLSYLALHLANGSLTPEEVFDILDHQGATFSRDELAKAGLVFDFGEKNAVLSLFYARSRRSRAGARSAATASKHTRPGRGRSSRSKGAPR